MHTVTRVRHLRPPQGDFAGEYGIAPPKYELRTQSRGYATFVLPKVTSQRYELRTQSRAYATFVLSKVTSQQSMESYPRSTSYAHSHGRTPPRAPQGDIAGEYGILPPKSKLCTHSKAYATS